MSQRKQKARPKPQRAADAVRKSSRFPRRAVTVSAAIALIGVAGIAYFRNGLGWKMAASPEETSGAQRGASAVASATTFQTLRGRWLRPDGGYVIEIRDAEAGGKLTAAYFNPQPIKVSRAEALHQGGNLKVFIELRDVGYPGSTYTLTYDPATDQIKGSYFQAAMRQTFEVAFVRLK